MFFEKGDIVLNFRRYKAYIYNPEIDWHKKETFYCRLATLSERKKILKVMKKKKIEYVSFADIGLRAAFINRWKYRDRIKEQIYLTNFQVFMLNKVMKENKLKDYTEVLDILISKYVGCKDEVLRKEREKIKNAKSIANELDKLVSELKKYLFNIILFVSLKIMIVWQLSIK